MNKKKRNIYQNTCSNRQQKPMNVFFFFRKIKTRNRQTTCTSGIRFRNTHAILILNVFLSDVFVVVTVQLRCWITSLEHLQTLDFIWYLVTFDALVFFYYWFWSQLRYVKISFVICFHLKCCNCRQDGFFFLFLFPSFSLSFAIANQSVSRKPNLKV